MIPRREHKKRPGKAGEQRARHVAYQRFYDAHKALQEGATEVVVEAFGVEYTLAPYVEDPESLVITRLHKGVVLALSSAYDYEGPRDRLSSAWYLTTKKYTNPPDFVAEDMVLGHVTSIRFLHEIPDGDFKSACLPYLKT